MAKHVFTRHLGSNPIFSPSVQNKTLEQESSQLEKDKKLLEKENRRLRQQAEIRDSKLDDNNQRISTLEKENRTMGKEMIFFRDSCTRVKDLERENKELVKQATIDKKTLITLREVRIALIVSKVYSLFGVRLLFELFIYHLAKFYYSGNSLKF